ncbi:3-isopropylmalate dehydratase large subunit [Roseiarcaceae bacterium H3SJ34-1]|uniref:3-isopropylmalate dehydratase large subunit n=1 Tax=Terripilifer ovatus TaxID=3032367 RepID=UPI003AB9A7D9|nr:3-isopropylmalate dehydratase large subunit [Roseiarcaceae bacterium H3SJ34-1]
MKADPNHGATLFDKIWARHAVTQEDGKTLLYIDRVVVDDVRASQVLKNMERRGLAIRRPDLAVVVQDHSVPSFATNGVLGGSAFLDATRVAARRHGLRLFDVGEAEQGISHVVMPELGLALPGSTYVCVDSHSPTVGGAGALGLACGSTELEHVLATQTMWVRKPRQIRIRLDGELAAGLSAKDVILHVLGEVGLETARGAAIEFAGTMIDSLSVEERLTICNMAVELGARTALVAPDEVTFAWLASRRFAPQADVWRQALGAWEVLRSDDEARFDADIAIDCRGLEPQITWGTTPAQVMPITGRVPDMADASRAGVTYMGLDPGERLIGRKIDRVFIGSCTNARLSDLESAAQVLAGRKVAAGVKAVVVPGSRGVAREAEARGLRDIFLAAGFLWGEPGCSMCAGGGGETVAAGERIVSTTNRNFEGRQGTGVRTHLASPATAAAAAVRGEICDPRPFMQGG